MYMSVPITDCLWPDNLMKIHLHRWWWLRRRNSYETEELLLNCLPLICLGGRADDHRVGGRHYFAISPPPSPDPPRGFACNALLDLWLGADMDLSREQQYISTRDTERWGRGRRCVQSAESTLIQMLCQFGWTSVLSSQYSWLQIYMVRIFGLFLNLWNLTNGLLFMWHCACHCPAQPQTCPCCQYQAMNRGGDANHQFRTTMAWESYNQRLETCTLVFVFVVVSLVEYQFKNFSIQKRTIFKTLAEIWNTAGIQIWAY